MSDLPELNSERFVQEAGHRIMVQVIQIVPALRTRHVRGVDENNPNRFWNRPDADWVPQEHRKRV